jgi:hypothetical protein
MKAPKASRAAGSDSMRLGMAIDFCGGHQAIDPSNFQSGLSKEGLAQEQSFFQK